MSEGAVSAGAAADLSPGAGSVVLVGGVEVLVANLDGTFYAVENECSHRGCVLSDGDIEGTTGICPCHGASFDLRTGEVLGGPAPTPLRTYAVSVIDGIVLVDAS